MVSEKFPENLEGGGFLDFHIFLRFFWKTSTIWSGPTDIKIVFNVNSDKCCLSLCPYKLKTIFWTKFLTPARPQFCGHFQITSIVIKAIDWNQNVWHLNSWISRCLAMTRKPNFWPHLGLESPNGGLNFFCLLIQPESAIYHCYLVS